MWIKPFRNQKGFSLIEMMVVVAIIAMLTAVTLPSVSSYFQISLNSATRDLATATKEAYNSTIITGKVHRMVYDLKENQFWVESGPSDALLDTKETKEKSEKRRKFANKKTTSSTFMMETSITRTKKTLPRGVVYEDIVNQQSTDPVLEGVTYTHFFPHGITEQTIIHLKDQTNHHASLVITPLIGMTELYDRYVNAKEAFNQ